MGCLSKGVEEGTRWSPEKAPHKHEGRLKLVEIMKRHFKPDQQVYTLSLPGALPIMENLIFEAFPNSFFDLIERDENVFVEMLNGLLWDSPDTLFKQVTIHNLELRKFFFQPQERFFPDNQYDMVILDLMGGWNREYCSFFETMFAKPYVKPGTLIAFTYCPFNRFHQNIDKTLLPFRFEDLLKKFPMELIAVHDYNDSNTHLYTMKTVVFKVTEEGKKTMQVIDTRFDLYNSLYNSGWRPAHEIVNSNVRAVTWFIKSLKDDGIDYKVVDHGNVVGGISRITLFPPSTHNTIKWKHKTYRRGLGLATASKVYTDRLVSSDLDTTPEEALVEEMTKVVPATAVVETPDIPSMTMLNKPVDAVSLLQAEHPDLYKAVMLMKALKELNIL